MHIAQQHLVIDYMVISKQIVLIPAGMYTCTLFMKGQVHQGIFLLGKGHPMRNFYRLEHQGKGGGGHGGTCLWCLCEVSGLILNAEAPWIWVLYKLFISITQLTSTMYTDYSLNPWVGFVVLAFACHCNQPTYREKTHSTNECSNHNTSMLEVCVVRIRGGVIYKKRTILPRWKWSCLHVCRTLSRAQNLYGIVKG